MNTTLPHFGSVVEALLKCLPTANAQRLSRLSERTLRSISIGEPKSERTWDEYANTVIDEILDAHLFPLCPEDRRQLLKTFHGYRQSYEQLNEAVSVMHAPSHVLQRGVVRLALLDLSVRYTGLCLSIGVLPDADLKGSTPEWGTQDGGNRFWLRALDKVFPGLPKVDSKEADGDCAARLQMNRSKMCRCLYENDFPGVEVLSRLFKDNKEQRAALRFYAAFALARLLANSFGQDEVNFWSWKLNKLSRWLCIQLGPIKERFNDQQRSVFLKRLILGGAGDPMVQGFFKDCFGKKIPAAYRTDLLSIAGGNPDEAISSYAEFCSHFQNTPPKLSWEEAYDDYQSDFEHFQQTGVFLDGSLGSNKLQLLRTLRVARERKDLALEEQAYRGILELDPLAAPTHQMLAQLLEQTGRLDEAWQEYEVATASDPDFVLPLCSLADSKSRARLHQEALEVASRIRENERTTGMRALITGTCLIRASRVNEAIPDLEEAHSKGREPGNCAALLSHAHQQQGNEKEARFWEKQARHHGFTVQQVLRRLQVRPHSY